MFTLQGMIDNVSRFSVPHAQKDPACCAISVYHCLQYKAFATSYITSPQCDINKLRHLVLQNVASNKELLVTSIDKGTQLWATAVHLQKYSSYDIACYMGKLTREARGLTSEECREGITTVDDFAKIYSHIIDIMQNSKLDTEKIPIHIKSRSVLDVIDQNMHVDHGAPMVYMHVDELFRNAPGLHWLNFADKVLATHMVLPQISPILIQNDVERIISEVEERSKNDPLFIKPLGESFTIAYDFIHRERGKYYSFADSENCIELAAFVYRLDRMLDNAAFKTIIDDPDNTEGRAKGVLNAVRHYSAIDFIETVLMRKMNNAAPKGEHLRCFVFTCGASSTSVLCNTENNEFHIFDSHGAFSGNSPLCHSTSYYARNRFGFFKLIHRLYTPNLLSSQTYHYVDISEIDLVQEDFDIINNKCNPFHLL